MSINHAHLIKLIQEGVLETPPWQSLVREIRKSFGAGHVDLLFHRARSHVPDFFEVLDFETRPAGIVEQYRNDFAGTNPLPYFSMQAGKAYSLAELLGGEVENNTFFREFLQPAGLEEMIMFYVEEPGGVRCWVSIARPRSLGPFQPEDYTACEWMVEYLQSALKVYAGLKVLELDRDIYASALRNLHMGYILLDQRGNVMRMDDVARRLLDNHADIHVSGNQLKARQPAKNAELQELLAEGLQSPEAEFSRALNIHGARNMGLLIKTAPDSIIFPGAIAPQLVVYVNEQTAPAVAPKARIEELFELSPTEAALVVELVHGRTLAEAAANIHITEQTARSYSKRIFSKTGTRRQAELVRLILTSVALVA